MTTPTTGHGPADIPTLMPQYWDRVWSAETHRAPTDALDFDTILAAIRRVPPTGAVTAADLDRAGVTQAQWDQAVEDDLEHAAAEILAANVAAQRELDDSGTDQWTGPTTDAWRCANGELSADEPDLDGRVLLEHFVTPGKATVYYAEADCEDCDADGLIAVEDIGYGDTNTCPCVIAVDDTEPDTTVFDATGPADPWRAPPADLWQAPATAAPSAPAQPVNRVEKALRRAEAACQRIEEALAADEQAEADRARQMTHWHENDRAHATDVAADLDWELNR